MINLPAHFYVPVRDRAPVVGYIVAYAKTAFEIPMPALAAKRRLPLGAGDERAVSSGNASAHTEGTGSRVIACLDCASVSAFALSVFPAREGTWHRPQT